MSNADSNVDSSSAASIVREPSRSLCADAGTPVIGSRRALRCSIVHDGEIRRSDDELIEEIRIGMSIIVDY